MPVLCSTGVLSPHPRHGMMLSAGGWITVGWLAPCVRSCECGLLNNEIWSVTNGCLLHLLCVVLCFLFLPFCICYIFISYPFVLFGFLSWAVHFHPPLAAFIKKGTPSPMMIVFGVSEWPSNEHVVGVGHVSALSRIGFSSVRDNVFIAVRCVRLRVGKMRSNWGVIK